MESPLKILLVEDLDSDADLIIQYLKRENVSFTFIRVWRKDTFVKSLLEDKPDIVISDFTLPQFSGIEAFHLLRAQDADIPFILISGSISEKLLTQYMKEGIDEYIIKGNLLRLPSAIRNVMNKNKIERLNHELDATNKKLKDAYNDMKDSINCAQKIQSAMLPDIAALHHTFPGSFVSFKPKDILSGDFFWFEKKENRFFIAVADCTGHGVPGALLSIMGNNLLSEALNIKKLTQPAEILNRLNKRVRRILNHNKTHLHEGMDIVFCSIHLDTNVVEYAGANRPLYIMKKGGGCTEIRANKMSIGEIENATFVNHTINLAAEDRIFLFTDGFADQFSSKNDKKMTKKRLLPLLTKTSLVDIDMQEKIVNSFFEEWKGNKEQIDDVLLVGIELNSRLFTIPLHQVASPGTG